MLVEQYVGRLQVPVHYMSPGYMLSYKVVSLGDDDDRDDGDDDGEGLVLTCACVQGQV